MSHRQPSTRLEDTEHGVYEGTNEVQQLSEHRFLEQLCGNVILVLVEYALLVLLEKPNDGTLDAGVALNVVGNEEEEQEPILEDGVVVLPVQLVAILLLVGRRRICLQMLQALDDVLVPVDVCVSLVHTGEVELQDLEWEVPHDTLQHLVATVDVTTLE